MSRLFRGRWASLVRRERREDGVAMAMVIGVAAVMMILVATMATGSVSGSLKASHDEDWNAAIDAAYAGISDYQGRLANDYTYVQYGNPASNFGAGPNRVVALPPTDNPAFGVGINGKWATVAGSGGNASYRYEVDNSSYSATGVLKVRATGRVGTTTRSVVADLKQQGFIDYLYFTDYEIRDPDLAQDASCATLTPKVVANYAWALPKSSPRPTSCMISFAADDHVAGPLHSNDTIVMCGGTYDSEVSTSNPTKLSNGYLYSTAPCARNSPKPTFVSGPIVSTKTIKFPLTNDSMKQETRTDLPLTVQRPGCLYTGPTSIVFNGATMTVKSPWTKFPQVSGDPVTKGTASSLCGAAGDPSKSQADNVGTLAGAAGVILPVLDHNLIYVQSVPAVSTDPNYWAASSFPNNATSSKTYCVGADGTTAGNGLGYPMVNEAPDTAIDSDAASSAKGYQCRSGDVFVQGTFDAAMTIAADHYVFVTGNLVRKDTQNDILGLVGTNAVWVYNPMSSAQKPLLSDAKKVSQIDAAILSTAHSFQVQNYAIGGSRGDLTVNGSIAQEFRGTVASGSNGYTKDYVYDPRFHAIAPPKFLSPVSTTYGINVLVEVKSAFDSTGAPAS